MTDFVPLVAIGLVRDRVGRTGHAQRVACHGATDLSLCALSVADRHTLLQLLRQEADRVEALLSAAPAPEPGPQLRCARNSVMGELPAYWCGCNPGRLEVSLNYRAEVTADYLWLDVIYRHSPEAPAEHLGTVCYALAVYAPAADRRVLVRTVAELIAPRITPERGLAAHEGVVFHLAEGNPAGAHALLEHLASQQDANSLCHVDAA